MKSHVYPNTPIIKAVSVGGGVGISGAGDKSIGLTFGHADGGRSIFMLPHDEATIGAFLAILNASAHKKHKWALKLLGYMGMSTDDIGKDWTKDSTSIGDKVTEKLGYNGSDIDESYCVSDPDKKPSVGNPEEQVRKFIEAMIEKRRQELKD